MSDALIPVDAMDGLQGVVTMLRRMKQERGIKPKTPTVALVRFKHPLMELAGWQCKEWIDRLSGCNTIFLPSEP